MSDAAVILGSLLFAVLAVFVGAASGAARMHRRITSDEVEIGVRADARMARADHRLARTP